ncbi:hypothetical protein ACTWPT_31415 [Nonomuraea sp. 3N208]|uniref:hypothetical protein n=1 Tax=Nonomuraea sp. 3N208 TaxID=3457421 RepID=UPI003FD5E507
MQILIAASAAQSESNFIPLVAHHLVTDGQFEISADGPDMVGPFWAIAPQRE